MAHDVFISYSTEDRSVAASICIDLEKRGIRCWIAPRDIPIAEPWPKAISDAIANSSVMVLILSKNSNQSAQVNNEVDKYLPTVVFRIDESEPSESMRYSICHLHWLNAFDPPLEKHLSKLAEIISTFLPGDTTRESMAGTGNERDKSKEQRQIFLSYAEEDTDIAEQAASSLEAAGYSVWYYKRDYIGGSEYAEVLMEQIECCRAFAVVISPASINSNQVNNELLVAHEGDKKIFPLLCNITHKELKESKPTWRFYIGGATGIEISPEAIPMSVPGILKGLKYLGIEPQFDND
jgi:hypothetical protein